MKRKTYDEIQECRTYLQAWCDIEKYSTEDERAVFFAYHANAMREKSRFMRPDRQAEELAKIVDALPMEHPKVAESLADGLLAFRDRVTDRIWQTHHDEFSIHRCSKCASILGSPLAKQCLWCGLDWHDGRNGS